MQRTVIRGKEETDFIWFRIREGDKTKIIQEPFKNYFYILELEYHMNQEKIQKLNKYISDIEFVEKLNLRNEKCFFVKLILSDNLKRNELKYKLEGLDIKHFEADINAVKRWLIDKNVELNPQGLNWLMYDIETKDDGSFNKDMNGTIIALEPILSISYKDNEGNQLFLKNENKENPFEGEKELLKKHNEIIGNFDCILAWNSYRFDDAYCKQRNEFHGLSNLNYEMINQLDYMEIFKKNYIGLESYSLNNVAKALNVGTKLDMEGQVGKGGVYKKWLDSFEGDTKLKDYNIQDVELMYLMEKKVNFIELHKKESELAHCLIQETMHNSELNDYMLLNRFKDYVSPSRPNSKEVEERKNKSILGAYTFCNNPGIHEDVFVFDFKSFYPTTMADNNICVTTILYHNDLQLKTNYVTIPENYLERNKIMEKAETKYFDNSKPGIISELAYWLIKQRDEAKYNKYKFIDSDPIKYKELDLYEKAIKIVANSLYGAMSFIYFRYYNYDVASSVTQFARGIIQACIKKAEELGFVVIQGDTDSIMFKQGTAKISYKELEYEFYKFFDEIVKERNMNSKKFLLKNPKTKEFEEKNHFIVFEHEKTFKRMISIKKKNYADLCEIMDGDGNSTSKIEISITGLECKRKDTNLLAKELQYELIENILKQTLSMDEYIEKLYKLYDEIKENKLNIKYLVMKKSLNKNPEDYGQAVINSKTGEPKLKKDGTPMFSPIPAHVKLAKELIAKGHDIYVGNEIEYIVKSTGPIEAISIYDYLEGSDFDREYYWERIITPVLKILFVTYPQTVIKNYKLWFMKEIKEKQVENVLKKLYDKCLKTEEDETNS